MKLAGSIPLPARVVSLQVLKPIAYGNHREMGIAGLCKEVREGKQREWNKGREILIPLMSHQEKSLQHARGAS